MEQLSATEIRDVAYFGAKGGGGNPHTPTEASDSLHSTAIARILVALGEGEFDMRAVTARSIYLGGTPIQNTDGTYNFPNVKWEIRSGTQTQEPITGFPAIENETAVGIELKQPSPWVQSLTNTNIDAVNIRLGFSQMTYQESDGDVVGTNVQYRIELATDGGGYVKIGDYEVVGKTTSGNYERTHRVDLPKASTGWQVRVTRLSADSGTVQRVVNPTAVKAYSQIVDARLRYPHTALLYVEFDARSFQDVPKISIKTRGRIIQVPSNYQPESRTYLGNWDGNFKWAWSNNPAWVFYDLCASDRFGIGKRMLMNGLPMLDKWDLYAIAQRCDALVSDGKGGNGTEPRFMCDVYVASRTHAWNLVRDLCAIFSGMMWWGDGKLNVLSDMPGSTAHVITRANVIDGKIVYNSGNQQSHYSNYIVNYCEPDNHYQDTPAAGQNIDLTKRWGANTVESTAIGCTRASEAHRRGQWLLMTNSYDRTAVWSVGAEGLEYRPGSIVGIANERVQGRTMGGRVVDCTGRNQTIKVDRKTDAANGDTFMVRTLGGTVEKRVITVVTHHDSGDEYFLETPLTAAADYDAVFVIDSGQLAVEYFRVTSVKPDPDKMVYEVRGVVYKESKYDVIDSGARLDERPISLIPTNVIQPPDNIVITSYETVNQGSRSTTMRAEWDAVLGKKTAAGTIGGAVAYEAQWRRGSNNWISVPRTGVTDFEVSGIYEGDYYVRVRAINSGEASSEWAYSVVTHLTGRQGAVPKPLALTASPLLYGIQWTWAFAATDAEDTAYTELEYQIPSQSNVVNPLSNVAYPTSIYQQSGITIGTAVKVRARCVDRLGNASDWTDWVQGEPNDNSSDYLSSLVGDYLTRDDGQRLTEQLNANFEGMVQNALNQGYMVDSHFKTYGAIKAGVAHMTKVQADADRAFAEYQTTVTAQFEANSAILEQKMTSVFTASGGSALFSLKAGVNYNGGYYDAGMVIGVVADGNGVKTSVGFNANQFFVVSNQGGTKYSPFTIDNGNVIINTALIGNATIDGAKIKDATITFAKFSGGLQSDTYDGYHGWKLDKTSFYFGSRNGNKEGSVFNETGLAVYDENGIERTKVGKLS